MPWCENRDCGKRDLSKNDVVFDEVNQRVLCIPCGQRATVLVPELKPEVIEKSYFGLHYTTDRGLHAEFVLGGARVDVRATNDQLTNFLGFNVRELLG